MNKITTLGIDLAKSVFQLHGIDLAGKVVLRREVRRAQLMKTIAQLEPCLIGTLFTAARGLPRHQPHPGRQLPTIFITASRLPQFQTAQSPENSDYFGNVDPYLFRVAGATDEAIYRRRRS